MGLRDEIEQELSRAAKGTAAGLEALHNGPTALTEADAIEVLFVLFGSLRDAVIRLAQAIDDT